MRVGSEAMGTPAGLAAKTGIIGAKPVARHGRPGRGEPMSHLPDSPISTTVDYHRDGVQHGFLTLPHSHDDSAWGSLMIPIAVVRNGAGPTVLLTGGNHGDEYEGITALIKLANRLRARDIAGRVIIVPMMNHPAALNGTRTSPID